MALMFEQQTVMSCSWSRLQHFVSNSRKRPLSANVSSRQVRSVGFESTILCDNMPTVDISKGPVHMTSSPSTPRHRHRPAFTQPPPLSLSSITYIKETNRTVTLPASVPHRSATINGEGIIKMHYSLNTQQRRMACELIY